MTYWQKSKGENKIMLIYFVSGKEKKLCGSSAYLLAIIDTFADNWDSWWLYTANGSLIAIKDS